MDTTTLGEQIRTVLTARVEVAIAWLNVTEPAGWPDRIDLDRLDMQSPWNCVGAQLAPSGHYNDFKETFRPPHPTAFAMDCASVMEEITGERPTGFGACVCDTGYTTLTDIWKTKIAALKDAA